MKEERKFVIPTAEVVLFLSDEIITGSGEDWWDKGDWWGEVGDTDSPDVP